MRLFLLCSALLLFPAGIYAQIVSGPDCLPAPSGLTAWWTLDDTTGTVIDDITGGFHGEASASIGTSEGPVRLPWESMEPMVLGALGFSGHAFIKVPHQEALDPRGEGFTVDLWLQVVKLAADEVTVIGKGGKPGQAGWRIYLSDPANPTLHVEGRDTTAKQVFHLQQSMATGTWHFVALTLKRTAAGADSVSLFLNGEPAIALPLDTLPDIRSTEPLFIGGDGNVTGIFALDEIEIYHPPLDTASLRAIFQAGRRGKCRTGRICIRKFNDYNSNGLVDIVIDRNGYVYHRDEYIPGWAFYFFNTSGTLVDSLVTTMGEVCLSLPAPATYTVEEENRPGWVPTTPTPRTVTLHRGQTLHLSFGNHQEEGSCAPPPPKMSAWWPMDDAPGATEVRDIVGGLDGTPSGGAVGPGGPGGPISTSGKVGQALGSGGGSYTSVADHAYLNPGAGEFSVDAWVYIHGGPTTVLRKMQDNAGVDAPGSGIPLSDPQWTAGYILYTEPISATHQNLHYGVKATDGTYLGGSTVVQEGKWYHVALVLRRQGGTPRLELYLNGQPAGQGTGTATLGTVTNTFDLLLGGDGNDLGELKLDEVEIFRKALSQAEVWSIFNADSLGKCKKAGLCFLKYNDLDGNGIQDPPYEVPLMNWSITVQDTAGTVVDSVLTQRTPVCVEVDAPAKYVVEEQVQPGWTPTTPNPRSVAVEPGESLEILFGNQKMQDGVLCVLKFEDANGNGVQDSTETLLSNWTMTVQDSSGTVIDSLVTTVAGPTCTTLPAPATYVVEEQVQSGWTPTTSNPQTVTLQSGQVVTVSFGNQAQTSGCVPPPGNMIGWWTLDATSGTLEADIAGTPQHGHRFNNPTPVPGKVGVGLKFNGINHFVNIPDDPALNPGTSDFSLDFWMKADTSSSIRALVGKRQQCAHSSFYELRLQPSSNGGRIHAAIDGPNGTNWNHFNSTIGVDDNQWHHVALVRQDTTLTLYIDGVVQGTGSTSGITYLNNTAPLSFGWSPCISIDTTVPYDGYLDEVEYFNRALTPQEVQAIYQAGSAGKCKPSTDIERDTGASAVPYAVDVYPNPSVDGMVFRISLPEAGPVALKIYDLLGREVAVLWKGRPLSAGVHEVRWKPGMLNAGVYFYRLEARGVRVVGSFVRIR